jgi:methylmalonyl-CoA epimerase
MENKLAHIAIAVDNINESKSFFELITGNSASEQKLVDSQQVNTSFVRIGETHIELLEPTANTSPISKFLANRGGGIHHLCIETNTFDDLVYRVTSMGIRTLSEPFIGAKNKRVVFFHPKDTYNVLIELEEA